MRDFCHDYFELEVSFLFTTPNTSQTNNNGIISSEGNGHTYITLLLGTMNGHPTYLLPSHT